MEIVARPKENREGEAGRGGRRRRRRRRYSNCTSLLLFASMKMVIGQRAAVCQGEASVRESEPVPEINPNTF